MLKKSLRLLGPLLFIFIFWRVVDSQTTLKVLKEIRTDMLLASLLLFPAVIAALTLRWWVICRRLRLETAFKDLFRIGYIAWFLSALPLVGISPLAKMMYLKEAGRPAATAAVSITLDKVFDLLGLLAFGLFGLVYFPQSLIDQTGIWLLIVACLAAAIFLWAFGGRLWPLVNGLLKHTTSKGVQRLGSSLQEDVSGFWSGFEWRDFSLILAISIAIGVLRAVILYILAVSLHISVGFGFIIACRALIGLVNVIPVSISGLGTRDAVLLLTLPVAGVTPEAAVALGLAAFLWTLASKFSGVFFWLKHPLPLNRFHNIQNKIKS
jgi:uncharacterized protein (TIRG00374 family)